MVRARHPFSIDAFVLLPDHLRCLWTLPLEDCDYPMRWMRIKSYFTRRCSPSLKATRSVALDRKRLHPVCQQRYWERQVRDDRDFERHCDYIHYNPVKHGHITRVADGPYSSFHRFVRFGTHSSGWAGDAALSGARGFGE